MHIVDYYDLRNATRSFLQPEELRGRAVSARGPMLTSRLERRPRRAPRRLPSRLPRARYGGPERQHQLRLLQGARVPRRAGRHVVGRRIQLIKANKGT